MRVERPEGRGRRGPSRRWRIILVAAAVALFVALLSLRGIARFYTDYLWFEATGFESVWQGLLTARLLPAVVFTAVFFVVLLVNLVIADRLAPTFIPAGPEEEFVERYREVIKPYAGRLRVGVALVFALIAGGGVSARWHEWILFNNRVDFGVQDPQFGTDVGFYVFQLPFLEFIFEWTFAALIIVFLVVAVAHYLNGGIRVRSPFEKVTPAVKAHLSVLLAVIALVRAFGYWLDRFELNFSTRGAVHGAGYTDINAQLPAINLLLVISLVGAALFVVNIWRRGWVLPVLGVGLWAFVSLVVGQIYPAIIQNFQVEPEELSREAPYIDRNIEATRAAFGLEDVEVKDFPYQEALTGDDLAQNEPTVENVRLWDPQFLPDTYRQLQRIRNFYEFQDVDIDRYVVDGEPTQTVLSARELDLSELPQDTWINRHLVFTHGYGVVISPANAVDEDGEPTFLMRDIPPESEDITIDEPAIYYGERMGGFAIVNSREEEFDYPQPEGTEAVTTRYEGEGGVEMNNFFDRASFGLRFADFRFFVSNEITAGSRVVFERDIRRRVEKAAPFLEFDADPYPVVVDGRVQWVVDAYTATQDYPYSQAVVPDRISGASGLNRRLNYVRNSVKATVDAYDGEVTFYVIDDSDPLVQAYRKAFPDLFVDGDEMSDDLRAHLRYPDDLFRIQTDLYASYHMEGSREFYNRSDQWAIARDPGSGAVQLGETGGPTDGATGETRTTATAGGRALSATTTGEGRMEPYYLMMRLPDQPREEFVLLQPYSPPARQELGNLLAFMVAKSDPGSYGELEAFVMPRGRQVFGPTQVNAQINTTTEISEQLTLLNREGSSVLQGNLQLIPIEDSILYVRPLYVQASGETQFPQLEFVIVFYGGDAVMETSLDAALARLFEGVEAPDEPDGEEPSDDGSEEPSDDDAEEPAISETVAQLLTQAREAFRNAQQALADGDLGRYQSEVERMGDLISRAQDLQEGESGSADGDSGGDSDGEDSGGDGSSEGTSTATAPPAEA